MKGFWDGKWTGDFESYTLDQFPLREQFRTLKSLLSLGVYRQKDNHGVYLADGFVSKLEYPLNEDSIKHAQERFRFVYDKYLADTDVKPYLAVIPDKNYYLAKQNGYPGAGTTMRFSRPCAITFRGHNILISPEACKSKTITEPTFTGGRTDFCLRQRRLRKRWAQA